MKIDQFTKKECLPRGFSIMFSSFDYFSKWLIFTSYIFYKGKRNNEVFSLFSKSKQQKTNKCSTGLLSDIGVILEKSCELGNIHLSQAIDDWAGQVSQWKQSSTFLTDLGNMHSFVSRSNVLVGSSLFVAPNSSTDLERPTDRLINRNLYSSLRTGADIFKQSKHHSTTTIQHKHFANFLFFSAI